MKHIICVIYLPRFVGQVASPKESFFLQTLRCRGGLGEVLVAPQELGDIATVTLGQALQGIMVTEGGPFQHEAFMTYIYIYMI